MGAVKHQDEPSASIPPAPPTPPATHYTHSQFSPVLRGCLKLLSACMIGLAILVVVLSWGRELALSRAWPARVKEVVPRRLAGVNPLQTSICEISAGLMDGRFTSVDVVQAYLGECSSLWLDNGRTGIEQTPGWILTAGTTSNGTTWPVWVYAPFHTSRRDKTCYTRLVRQIDHSDATSNRI